MHTFFAYSKVPYCTVAAFDVTTGDANRVETILSRSVISTIQFLGPIKHLPRFQELADSKHLSLLRLHANPRLRKVMTEVAEMLNTHTNNTHTNLSLLPPIEHSRVQSLYAAQSTH